MHASHRVTLQDIVKKNYRQDPSALTMKQVQIVLEKMNLSMEELLLI